MGSEGGMGPYTFDWRPDEHARVTALLVRERMRRPLARIFFLSVAVVVALALALSALAIVDGTPELAFPLLPLALTVGALSILAPALVGRIQAWQMGRIDPNVRAPIRHDLTAEGVRMELRTTRVELGWEGMAAVRETNDFFLFFYSPRHAYYLPKRVVPRGEVEGIRRYIRIHRTDAELAPG
jgi:hypothetical protein